MSEDARKKLNSLFPRRASWVRLNFLLYRLYIITPEQYLANALLNIKEKQ